MNWGHLFAVFILSTFKFMLAPFYGSGFGLPFWETFITCTAGGTFSAAVFYFSSELFIKWSHNRKVRKREEALKNGHPLPVKRKFTKTNRTIIKVKWSLGIYGICFWAPLFLSVPVGSIIVAKFYGKLHKTFPLIAVGMALNSMILSGIAYLLF